MPSSFNVRNPSYLRSVRGSPQLLAHGVQFYFSAIRFTIRFLLPVHMVAHNSMPIALDSESHKSLLVLACRTVYIESDDLESVF